MNISQPSGGLSSSNINPSQTSLVGNWKLNEKPIVTASIHSLTFSANVTTDVSLASTFKLELTGNTTLENPINAVDGAFKTWWIKQDATGGRTITLGNAFTLPSSASPLAWSTAASKMDMLGARYDATNNKWYVVAFVPGYNA